MYPDTLPFLNALYASVQGYITLTAIHPDGKRLAPSRHIRVDDEVELHSALDRLHKANRRGWGAYVSIATRKGDLGHWRRGGRCDLLALPSLFVDIDREPAQAIARLHACSCQPSCIIRSGFGIHAHWFLQQPTTAFDQANHILHDLAIHFDGDTTNVAQMLRLPGSINTKPTRQAARCQVIELYPDRRYHLIDFAEFATAAAIPHRTDSETSLSTLTLAHDLNPALIRGVADCLVAEFRGHVKANGYIASLCPCGHCRDYPGSHFNFDASRAIGLCFGRHGRLLLKDLCELLRIDPASYGGLYA